MRDGSSDAKTSYGESETRQKRISCGLNGFARRFQACQIYVIANVPAIFSLVARILP